MNYNDSNCPSCRRQASEPINMMCNHHLCFRCAQKILILDSESFQRKYKIVCPACRKTTLTYDLRHLIISETEYDEDLFVTTKYLKQKAEVQPRGNNYISSTKQSDNIESLFSRYQQNKKLSSSKERVVQPQYPFCSVHPQSPLKYYCQDDKNLLCIDCLRYHKDHNIGDINNFREEINGDTVKMKEGLKVKLNEIKKSILNGSQHKKMLIEELDGLQKELDEEFRGLRSEIDRKYQQLNKKLKQMYFIRIQQQSSYLQSLTSTFKVANQHIAIPIIDFPSQLKFYSSYYFKLKNVKFQQRNFISPNCVWDKDDTDVLDGLTRFMRLKEIGLTSSHQHQHQHQRHKSGNQPSYHHNVSAIMEVSRKGSVVGDDLGQRPSMTRSKENRGVDGKRFKF